MKLKKEHFIGIAGVVGIVYYVFFCKKGDDSTPTGEEPSSGGGGGFGGGGFPTGALTTDTPKPPAKEEVKPIVVTDSRFGPTGPIAAGDPRNNPIRTDIVGPMGNPVGTGTVGGGFIPTGNPVSTGTVGGGFIPFPKTTGGARPTTGRTGPVVAAGPNVGGGIVGGIKGVGGISGTGNNTGGIIPASQGGSPTPYTTGTKATSSTTVQGGNVFMPFAGKQPLTVHNLLM
jgi:hypothetical protein